MLNKNQPIAMARRLMRSQHSGVLATHSLAEPGFPFGSIAPYFMTESGDWIIYASDIAQHSKNMAADPKVSLCVFDPTQTDSQANGRITILATQQHENIVHEHIDDALCERYFSLFPQARGYEAAHDFKFYAFKPHRVRYIGGFGDIYWFSSSDWQASGYPLAQHEHAIIQHMHEDHSDALALMINALTDLGPAAEGDIQMLSCYAEGFHYQFQDNTYFMPFEQVVDEHHDVRAAMVQLTHQARRSIQAHSN